MYGKVDRLPLIKVDPAEAAIDDFIEPVVDKGPGGDDGGAHLLQAAGLLILLKQGEAVPVRRKKTLQLKIAICPVYRGKNPFSEREIFCGLCGGEPLLFGTTCYAIHPNILLKKRPLGKALQAYGGLWTELTDSDGWPGIDVTVTYFYRF
jgi:hypothetical protein